MRNTHTVVLFSALVLLLAGGCSQKTDHAALSESAALRAQLDERNAALEAMEADRRAIEMQNADLRRQLDDASARAGDRGRSTGFEGIEGVSSEFGNGMITVSIASDILFDSGRNTLKTNAQRSLDQVASVLRSQYAGREIKVVGHTDTDPIVKSGWKSNYHLGAERAYAVMEYLRSKGVPEKQMHIASYGPNRPLSSKSASRRVEIIVVMQ